MNLNDTQKKELLALARAAIASRFDGSHYELPKDEVFSQKCGIFVSLHQGGELRGCIGYIKGYKDMVQSVMEMAQAAAFRDHRFMPLTVDELPDLEIEISLLGEMELVTNPEEIEIGRHGLFLEHPHGSGLLLPQVATEWKWNRQDFLRQICLKAGVRPGAWQDAQAELYYFEALVFADHEGEHL